MDLISIIIPMYNSQETIERCLDSIIESKLTCYEIIVVNDGSTDKSSRIVEGYSKKYSNIKLYNISNTGVSNARNFGISKATGHYITFIDSDDTVSHNYLDTLIKLDKNNDLVIFNFKYVGVGKIAKYLEINDTIFSIEDFNNNFMTFFNYDLINSPCNKLYKLDIIKNNNLHFPLNLNLGEDLLFNLSYLQYCNTIRYIPNIIYNYHINANSLTTTIRMDFLQIQDKLVNSIKKYLVSNGIYDLKNKQLINRLYVNLFTSYIQDSFQGHIKKTKKREAFSIINEYYNKNRSYLKPRTVQQKILFLLVRFNSYNMIVTFFYCKNHLKKWRYKYK